jgi:hypothetical protein
MWIVRPKVVKKGFQFKWYHYSAAGISGLIGGLLALGPEFEKQSRTNTKQ